MSHRAVCILLLTIFSAGVGAAPPVGADEGAGAARAPAPDEKARAAELIADMKDARPEVRARAALAAVELQHGSLLSPLLRLLSDPELGVREAALKALATRTDKSAKRRAAAALNPRIARFSRREQDRYELMAVIECLRQLAQPSSVKPLLDGIKLDDELEVARARILAVGYVPHAEAVERLIQFLDRGRRHARAQHDAAVEALRFATGERRNRNPDQWRAWWRENGKDFDFEAVAAARAAAAAHEAERKAKQEEQRRKREERRRKKKEKPPPPEGGQQGPDDASVAAPQRSSSS